MKIWWFIKCFFGFGSIHDESTCWFSHFFWDIHDYHVSKGGDGHPSHFFLYECPKCKKRFFI